MIIIQMVFLFFLWFCSGPVWTSVIHRPMWYEPTPKTWENARDYCRSTYNGDLATVVTQAELDQMDLTKFYAWIGLKKEGSTWFWNNGWTDPQEVQMYFTTPYGNKECGQAQYQTTRPLSDDCENLHFFFCRYNSGGNRYDVFVPETMTWTGAMEFCVDHRQQFITVPIDNDLHWGSSPFYIPRTFPVWIGLYHHGDSWRWADGDSDYRNWSSGVSGASGTAGECGAVWSQNKSLSVESCSQAFPFLCYTHNLLLLQVNLSWEQAQEHCRSLQGPGSHHLLSVEKSEMEYAHSQALEATTSKVWVGLRFLSGAWLWSNGAPVSLSLPSCPESTLHCGALLLDTTDLKPTIQPSDCSERLNLLCYTY